VDGRDRLPDLLADDDRLASFEEGRLFGAEWLRTLGMIPNEYLQYYDFAREAIAATHNRGTFLLDQQERLYEALATAADPLSTWEASRRERDETYLPGRDEDDLAAGGYEDVALALMRAIARDEPATLILNVRNRGTLAGFDDDAVVEVPCTVDARGARPQPVRPLPDHAAALASAVKAADRAVLEAAETGSRRSALRAFATHPLIDSVTVAQRLLAAYEREFPELGYLRGTPTAHIGTPQR
jgi:6-phospho-beta-glucosidase